MSAVVDHLHLAARVVGLALERITTGRIDEARIGLERLMDRLIELTWRAFARSAPAQIARIRARSPSSTASSPPSARGVSTIRMMVERIASTAAAPNSASASNRDRCFAPVRNCPIGQTTLCRQALNPELLSWRSEWRGEGVGAIAEAGASADLLWWSLTAAPPEQVRDPDRADGPPRCQVDA